MNAQPSITLDDLGRRRMRLIHDPFVERGVEDMFCIYCGCTEYMPCPGGCAWIAPYVCSNCEDRFYGTEKIKLTHLRGQANKVHEDAMDAYTGCRGADYALELWGKNLHVYKVEVIP